MWDFKIGQALGLMLKTLPFILFRLAVYFGVALAYVLMTGVGAGVGWGVGGLGDEGFRAASTFWGGVVGFGIVGAIMYILREYLLYMVKAGHIAVLVELMDGKPLPQGRGQIEHASTVVKARFAQASVLFGVDQLIKGVLRAITGLARGIFRLLPIPGARQFLRLVEMFLRIAVGFIDEVILAYCIRTRSDNAWASSRDALVLYGQNAKPMLKNAAWLALIVYGLSFLVFLVMLAPAALVAYLIPGGWSATGVIVALLFAWSVKVAVLEPFAITCMMQAYFKAIEGQQPDAEWEAKLDGMSAKFRKLKLRATQTTTGDDTQGAEVTQ
ncbi:hypothetical protein LY622_18450 [Halomonas sp. M5N1S17]|uniref:hypothetical protein n=1 Tax=Halomonas alkalisoli TaxID=2907158 RepID=UPI001F233A96|nr:hypothetical protein [Halomonas alkalisoli]MCE9665408.1 hypothetical protein [Halomonas alkalisoli]